VDYHLQEGHLRQHLVQAVDSLLARNRVIVNLDLEVNLLHNLLPLVDWGHLILVHHSLHIHYYNIA
jgi:hypothetical protein